MSKHQTSRVDQARLESQTGVQGKRAVAYPLRTDKPALCQREPTETSGWSTGASAFVGEREEEYGQPRRWAAR
eukprot:4311964-Pleurochrysis_carterae.AAC.1